MNDTPSMRTFTFTYRETATARITPTRRVTCEGCEFSDKSVVLKEGRCWTGYRSLDEMYEAYSKHGKGTIRFMERGNG